MGNVGLSPKVTGNVGLSSEVTGNMFDPVGILDAFMVLVDVLVDPVGGTRGRYLIFSSCTICFCSRLPRESSKFSLARTFLLGVDWR